MLSFLPIPNICFVILIAVFTGYLTFLTTKGGLTDNRYSINRTWKRLTKRGKTVLYVLLILAFLLGIQEYNNQLASNNKDRLLKQENDKRDSSITAGVKIGVDSNSKQLFRDISEAFSKQGLRFDTVKNEIRRIRDSTANQITIINGSDPFLALCKEGPIVLTDQLLNSNIFDLNICNTSAPSRNINAKVYVVSVDSTNQMFFTKEFDLFQSNAQMDKDAQATQQIIVPANKKVTLCYFLVKGSWTNIDKSKSFKIDFIYHYNLEKKTTGGVTALHEKQIRDFLKTQVSL